MPIGQTGIWLYGAIAHDLAFADQVTAPVPLVQIEAATGAAPGVDDGPVNDLDGSSGNGPSPAFLVGAIDEDVRPLAPHDTGVVIEEARPPPDDTVDVTHGE